MRYARLLIAIVLGFLVGSLVNMLLVSAGHAIVPAPAGVDTSTVEGLRQALPLFGPHHFVFPFLAHALGTLAGAWLATRLARSWRHWPALAVGLLFFAGGLAMAVMVPAPTWFIALDLLLAYAPFAWLGYRLGCGRAAARESTTWNR